jgi:flagellar motor switch/type III secretory pathway protein FliN
MVFRRIKKNLRSTAEDISINSEVVRNLNTATEASSVFASITNPKSQEYTKPKSLPAVRRSNQYSKKERQPLHLKPEKSNLKLPKFKKYITEFNNHVVGVDFQCRQLSTFGIVDVRALSRLPNGIELAMYVIKFQFSNNIIGALVFHITLIDEILDYNISNDFLALPRNYQKAILEEFRIRLIKKYDILSSLHLGSEIMKLSEFMSDRVNKKMNKIKIIQARFKLSPDKEDSIFIVSNKTTFDIFREKLSCLPSKDLVFIPKEKINIYFQVLICNVFLTRAELEKIGQGTVILLSKPKDNNFVMIKNSKGVWFGSFLDINTIQIQEYASVENEHNEPNINDLELTVRLGGRSFSFEELEKFSPGYVVDSGQVLEKQHAIYVNNLRIGTCQLVDVEGNLGFRVLSIDPSLVKK